MAAEQSHIHTLVATDPSAASVVAEPVGMQSQRDAFLTLVRRVKSYAGANGEGTSLAPVDEDAELLLLLRSASALLRSEETATGVSVGQLDSNALRTCDLCCAEIFNRCIRTQPPPDFLILEGVLAGLPGLEHRRDAGQTHYKPNNSTKR